MVSIRYERYDHLISGHIVNTKHYVHVPIRLSFNSLRRGTLLLSSKAGFKMSVPGALMSEYGMEVEVNLFVAVDISIIKIRTHVVTPHSRRTLLRWGHFIEEICYCNTCIRMANYEITCNACPFIATPISTNACVSILNVQVSDWLHTTSNRKQYIISTIQEEHRILKTVQNNIVGK